MYKHLGHLLLLFPGTLAENWSSWDLNRCSNWMLVLQAVSYPASLIGPGPLAYLKAPVNIYAVLFHSYQAFFFPSIIITFHDTVLYHERDLPFHIPFPFPLCYYSSVVL